MRNRNAHRIWLTASLLLTFVTFVAGCSDPDKNGNAPGFTPPTVVSVAPPSGSVGACPNTIVTATFSEAMNPATINASTFTLSAPGVAAVSGQVTLDATGKIATFTPSSSLALNTAYTATITTGARDLFGNALAANFVWSFTTGASTCQPGLPMVISPNPPNGAAGICPNAPITATFSDAIDSTTVNATTFTLAGPGGAAVAGQVSYDVLSRVATFIPSVPLALNTKYTATITTGVKDLLGNALAANFVWSFTTGATTCQPTVISVTPPNGSTGICPNAPITATFSVAINPSTLNATTFTLTGPGGTAVAGQISYDPLKLTATFTPAVPLALNTAYTLTLTTGVKDLFGNPLAANFVSTFTTGASLCVPTVISNPPTGVTGICPNAPITATFSNPINPTTLTATTFNLTGPGGAAVAGQISYDTLKLTATFTPTTPLALNTAYTLTITTGVKDLFGIPLAANFVSTFTTGASACVPTVITNPPNGATGVCPNAPITAVFSVAINPATINATTFTLTGPGGTAVAGQISYDALKLTATFTPTSPLALNTVYTLTVTTGVKDLFGNSLAANVVITFTTGASTCVPIVISNPPNGAVGICPNAALTAVFSVPINPVTLNTTTFLLTGPGGVAVVGQVTYDPLTLTATFTPLNPLALDTVYTLTITTGVLDLFGNSLAQNFVSTFTTGSSLCAPTLVFGPPNGAIGICPNALITATFSVAIDSATINATTFTVTGPGGIAVAGNVTYDALSLTATFTPLSPLALNTVYTVTITTAVKDLFGNSLATNFVANFTTSAVACLAPVPLGILDTFVILAQSTVTNTGLTVIAGGDLGLSPGTAVTGFPPGILTPPAVLHVNDPIAAQAQLDLTFAYNFAAGVKGGLVLPGDLAGLTFTPGVYTNASTVMLKTGTVTLDAQGNANAVFVFQIGTTLTTLDSTQVVLAGNAQAKNVFWQVGSSATLGTNSIFKGTILALTSITFDTGATLQGRAFASNGAVTLDTNAITAP